MKKILFRFLFLGFVFALTVSCEEEKVEVKDWGFKPVGGSVFVEDDLIKGDGSIVFKKKFHQVFVKKGFKVEFKLNSGGFVTFHFFSGEDLQDGLDVTFSMDKEKKVFLKTPGRELKPVDYKKAEKGGFLLFQVDIYNDRVDDYGLESAHVFIWDGRSQENFLPPTAFFRDVLESRVEGGYSWGITLQGATIKEASSGNPAYAPPSEE